MHKSLNYKIILICYEEQIYLNDITNSKNYGELESS